MKKIIPLIILFPLLANAQMFDEFSVEVKEFSRLKVSNGVKVNIINGKPGVVQVKSRNVHKDDIIIEVSGKTLKLSIDAWSQLREKHDRWEVEIDLPLRTLTEITCVTGARVSSEFELSGSKMTLTSNTGGEAYLDLNYSDLVVTASTGAVLKLKGEAEYLEIISNMGAEVEADRLRADYVQAKAGMGGTLEVYSRREITSSASFGGVIEVFGNPSRSHTRKSLGGEVKGIR